MTAEILAVGTEILLGDIVNSNAAYLSRELARIGVNVYKHTVVGDNPQRLRDALSLAYRNSDLVVATGGLGPTEDDITSYVASEYFGVKMVYHAESWEAIVKRFAGISHILPENNKKQAYVPEGCVVLKNNNGTAPGVYLERDGRTLILLPGPPKEMEPMFIERALPLLYKKSNSVIVSKNLKIIGVGESRAAEILKDILASQTNPTVAPYAKDSEVWIRITASALNEREAAELIAPVASSVYGLLGDSIFGEDDDTLESVVVRLLRGNGMTVACAESCTGGLLTSRLVNVPGVSMVLREGAVTYCNESKVQRLGVKRGTLDAYGAVSEQTAKEMAEGIAKASGADVGISTTGVAGPDGGTPEKPVGLAYVGLYIRGEIFSISVNTAGNRERVRQRTAASALDFLRRELCKR